MTRPGVRVHIGPKFVNQKLSSDTASLRLEDSEHAVPTTHAPSDLDVNPIQPPAGTDPWKHIGRTLANKLRGNPEIDAALGACLGAGPGPSHPIRLEIQQAAAAALPWEALFDTTHQFLALDVRWPVVRVINPTRINRSLDPQNIRIAVVLSALNREGLEQWDAILNLTRHLRSTRNLGIRLKAFVSERSLLGAIQAAIHSLPPGEDWIAAETVTPRILQDIKLYQPHLLHIFSHGISGSGIRQLELAQIADWTPGITRGSVFIDISALAKALDGLETWLCTINACEGGQGNAESYAMAAELVEAGLPAAIGMREVIDKLDADQFCKAFYTEVLLGIAEIVHNNGGELALSDMIGQPRQQLKMASTAPSAAWALPILFVCAEPLTIDVVSHLADEEESSREDVIRGLRDAVEPAAARPELVSELSDAI